MSCEGLCLSRKSVVCFLYCVKQVGLLSVRYAVSVSGRQSRSLDSVTSLTLMTGKSRDVQL